MPVLEDTEVVHEKAEEFAKDFVKEMNKMEELPEPPLYHWHQGVHSTPVEKRSPYWQPVDDQS